MELFIFFVGAALALLANWLWHVMTGQSHRELVRTLDEHRASQENQRLLEEFLDGRLPKLGRRQIWYRMNWVWKETRGWVLRSGRFGSFVGLFLFALLYTGLWLKTLVWPDSHDLRLMLGGRSWLMYLVRNENNSSCDS